MRKPVNRRTHSEREKQIIEIASRSFRDRGFEGVSLSDLARALGLASDDPSQRAVSAFTGMLLHFLMNVPNELYRGREREWAEYFVRILREMIERLPVTEPKPF